MKVDGVEDKRVRFSTKVPYVLIACGIPAVLCLFRLDVALEAGVDVLAHVIEGTSGLTPSHLERMKRQDMALVPTLKLLGDGDDREAIRNEVRDYARLGGQILFGTDVGYLTDYDPRREYQLMAAVGLAWREILASLTTSPASRFGQSSRRGRVERGMEVILSSWEPIPV